MARKATKSKKAVSKKSAKRAGKKAPKKKKVASAKKPRVGKRRPAKKAVAKRAAPKPQRRPASPLEADFNNLVSAEAFGVTGAGANQKLLDQILGGHYGDDTNLDPPYDGPARAGLAARIQRAGVPVSSATVMACTKVGCVRTEMNRVNPGGR
jgi:hypothetical protein